MRPETKQRSFSMSVITVMAISAFFFLGCGKYYETDEAARAITLEAGTALVASPTETLSSVTAQAGDPFSGTLAEPLHRENQMIAPKGSPVVGRIVDVETPDDPGAEGRIAIQLTELTVAGGQSLAISTDTVRYSEAPGQEATDASGTPPVILDDTKLTFHLSQPAQVSVGPQS